MQQSAQARVIRRQHSVINATAGRAPLQPYPELEARYRQAVAAQALQLEAKNHGKLRAVTGRLQTLWQHQRIFALVGGASFAVLVLSFSVYTFWPQSIHYTFAEQRGCIVNPTILPNNFKSVSQGTFALNRTPTVSIAHTPIFSYRLCAQLRSTPRANSTYAYRQVLAGLRLRKSIRVTTGDYSSVADINLGHQAIAPDKQLVFQLSSPDATFQYAVVANGQNSLCTQQKTKIECKLAPLKFAYATSYSTSLVRMFHGQSDGAVTSQKLQTITATGITQTSIAAGTVVYDKPQQIILQTNKTITSLQAITLTTNGGKTVIPTTSSYSGQTITINVTDPLPRNASLDLHIANLTASDQSTLAQPYDLAFTTSGGPKVSGVNLPSYGVDSGATIAIRFNQALLAGQSAASLTSLTVNGAAQPATYSFSGNQILITPTTPYPVCAQITVQVNSQVQSNYGVAGDSAWSFSTRSHCYTISSIGTSVDGRPITAYKFGSGPSMVLYIGAMEGNEQNSSELLSAWLPNIDANPGKIPSYRTIVVIPTINPDGFAADIRTNAAGIDLNRNFPANNWQTQVTEPLANTVVTNDGGPYPLSAPESQALANFELANRPRLVLTEHSHGGIVEANDAGDSDALGAQYAKLAGYKAIPTSQIGNFFDYTTTGAFEDWVHDKLGLPVLEIELQSPTNDEYSRNLPALWAMAQISQ